MSSKETRTKSSLNRERADGLSDRRWVYGPWRDLIIGCGAWSAPLLIASYAFSQQSNAVMSATFYAMALLFNYPHFMATIYRAYGTREDFAKYKVFTLYLTLMLALTVGLTHWSATLLSWVFTIYVTWSPWHYSGQNFGLLMMLARRNEAQPAKATRWALFCAFVAAYLMIFLSFHAGPSNDQFVLSLGLTLDFARLATAVLLVMFAGLGIWGLARLVRETSLKAMIGPLVLFGTQFLWFVLPSMLGFFGSLKLPQTRYSSGVLAVMHSAQYLWVTSYFARREAKAAGRAVWKPLAYFATLVIGGIALFVPGPWVVSYVFRYDFGASFLAFTALINIHHFILDGAIWKLREGRIASLLIDTKAKVAASADKAGAALKRVSWRRVPRPLRVGVLAGLLVLAGVDQVRYYSGLDDQNARLLARALTLDPYDATLHVRLARIHAKAGKVDQTVDDLRKAVALRPSNTESQNMLARLLIDNRRYKEAYEHYRQMVVHHPSDVDALINLGILADQFGNYDEAVKSWSRAVSLDATQKNAYLYLAQSFDRDNDLASAVIRYEEYLGLLTADPDSERLDPKDVLSITLRLGELYNRTNRPDRAVDYLKRTIELAQQSGEKAMESAAYVSMAGVYASGRQPALAADLYQRALSVDRSSGDKVAEAMDWFNYGQFLQRAESSKQAALACLLRSEELLAGTQNAQRETVSKAVSEMEQRLGPEATVVRRNAKSLADGALTLKL